MASQDNAARHMAPIAIVGMSCRLPGDVSNLEEFWTLLSRSRSGWSPIPADRFSSDAYYHPNPQKRGCFNQKGGYFMKQDLSNFDAPFFHISKAEAMAMDPQQRQLLEITYEALENAGIPMEDIAGTRTGVFVGGTPSDYRFGVLRDLKTLPMFDSTGNQISIQAGRLSYYFDLRGPSFTTDTACSSSMHALHSAVMSIRAGESDSAVVAGCSLRLQPDDMVSMSTLGLFNDHGRTYAFDHRADSGFARGEGAGCLILKPLDQAIRDNDRIRSVIVNTGINQDGKTLSLTTPSGDAQEKLMREVYARANISPNDTGFVEAHGTGTKVGDPIEADAIHRVFGPGRTKRSPLYMGSVKTNIGHLENTSGIISVIKATLMLEKRFILPNINFEKANPAIPLDAWNFRVPTSIRPWPKDKRFASINNFGFGGANAHVVLDGYSKPLTDLAVGSGSETKSPRLIVLSANDEEAVRRAATALGIYVEQHPEVFQKRLLRDMAYTLGERRSKLAWRMAVAASSCDELADSLNSGATLPRRTLSKTPRVAFVYTGQGAQWAQMGMELIDVYPTFSRSITAAAECLDRLGAPFSLVDELKKPKDESIVNEAHISQPLCTAVQLALTDLLSSWGVKPSSVIGHSSGEIGAAYAAGAISLEDAMCVAFYRGKLSSEIKQKHPELRGAMMAAGIGAEEAKGLIQALGLSNVNVACHNSPNSVTISGDEESVDRLDEDLENRGQFHRKLKVDVAYHSCHMQLIAKEYLAAIEHIRSRACHSGVTFYSALLGRKMDDPTAIDASYWVSNLVEPVRFSPALQDLQRDSDANTIVELGPHAALEGPIKQTLPDVRQGTIRYFSALLRHQPATCTAVKLAGDLFLEGCSLNFRAINEPRWNDSQHKPAVIADFAPYPWTHQQYSNEPRVSKQRRLKPFPRHDLLGLLDETVSDSDLTWRNVLTLDDVPWIKDHKMQSLVTFPLAGYVSMAVEAICQQAQLQGCRRDQVAGFKLREVQVTKALIMDDGTDYETVLSMSRYQEGTRSYSDEWHAFTVSSWVPGRGWLEHCRGQVGVKKQEKPNPVYCSSSRAAKARLEAALHRTSQSMSLDKFYGELLDMGAGYSSVFRLHPREGFSYTSKYSTCDVTVPDTASTMPYTHETPSILSAPFLDLFFQLCFPLLGAGRGIMPALFMPSAIKEITISNEVLYNAGEAFRVVANGQTDLSNPSPVDFSVDAWHQDHAEPLIKMAGFRMTPIKGDSAEHEGARSLCYKLQWEPLYKEDEYVVDSSRAESIASLSADENVSVQSGPSAGAFAARRQHMLLRVGTDMALPSPGISTSGSSGAVTDDDEDSGSDIAGKLPSLPLATPATDISWSGSWAESASEVSDNEQKKHVAKSAAIDDRFDELSSALHYHKLQGMDFCIVSDRAHESPLALAVSNLMASLIGSKPSLSSTDAVQPSSTTSYIYLAEMDSSVLRDMTPGAFSAVRDLLLGCSSLLWVTAGSYHNATSPDGNMAQGLLRTVRSESSKAVGTLDLDPESNLGALGQASLIAHALKANLEAPDRDDSPVDHEFAEKNGRLIVPRIVTDEAANSKVSHQTQPGMTYLQDFEQPGRRLQIAVGTYGALDSLYWKDELELPLGPEQVEIKVAATGMNFKDVMIAMGQISSPYLGVESSGTVARVGADVTSLKVGDRVCAMSLGAYGTYARCPATSAAVIPDDLPFEVAASIPVVYTTAYYGLVEVAKMEEGESVLIHAASGGVGQAAIQLAQMAGVKIYATAGSTEKKQFLMETYGIPGDHIFYSRSSDFGSAVREATGGRGVDVVINSLAGDRLRETWECLAPFGRFIEIGKRDITSNTRLEMAKFEYNCTFSSVDMTLVAGERPKIMGRVLRAVMSLMAQGIIKPIAPITTIGISDLETSLRKLQSGKTTGKVVVSHQAGEQIRATHPPPSSKLLQDDATFVIVGGTGGLGRSMARRLISLGARHVVLLSRSGNMSEDLETLIHESKALGASVYAKACDVAEREQVDNLISELGQSLPPVRGVIHAAMVLKDVLFEKMTFDDYNQVVRSKVHGAWNFHEALLGSPLDFFVVLSSVAGIVGNRGQGAYAAANTYLDALTRHRRRMGLPSTSLNLTAVSDAGYLAADATKRAQVSQNLSGSAMTEAEVLALVQAAIETRADGGFADGQCITGLDFEGSLPLPYFASDAKFARLRDQALAKSADHTDSADAKGLENVPISQKLRRAGSLEEAVDLVTLGLRDKLGAILMLPLDVMAAQQATTSITGFGLDSLNAIELRNWIGKELQSHLQVLELLTSGGLSDLAALVLRKTRLEGVWSQKA